MGRLGVVDSWVGGEGEGCVCVRGGGKGVVSVCMCVWSRG